MEHDHSAHDHSSHGAGHLATSIAELKHPSHGSYEGHVVPGVMFIIWSTYWTWSIIDIHLRTRAARLHNNAAYLPLHTASNNASSSNKHSHSSASSSSSSSSSRNTGRGQPFKSRPWYPWPYWPGVLQMEPLIKIGFSLLGVLIELYIGWGGWRPLYKPDGHFAEFHANNWQHALMYSGVAVSGVVDLIGFYTPLPPGTEQGFLALSFLVETLLMGMHTKPNPLDQLVHVLLTWIMIACVVVSALEIAAPGSLLLALLRAMVVFFQGTWFWHVGAIMFRDNMAWDMEDMAAVMFVPVVFCLHMLLICLGTFSVYLFMRWLYARLGITSSESSGRSQQGLLPVQEADAASDIDVLLDSQLELTDYADTRSRDADRTKHTHRV